MCISVSSSFGHGAASARHRWSRPGWRRWRSKAGAHHVFDWSFYSQGTRAEGSEKSASADLFLAEALKFFGDPDPPLGSPWDRGARLAQLVSKTKSLLVLDG